MADAIIIDGRIVEFPLPSKNADIRFFFQFFIIPEDFFCRTVVFYNQNFVGRIRCVLTDGPNAVSECLCFIFIWNNNGNKRRSMHRILHAEKTEIFCMGNDAIGMHALQMCLDCPLPRIKRIHLTHRIICCGFLMCSPVIQDLRNMGHFPGYLHTAENKVMILCPVKFPAESSCLLHNASPDHKKMADIIIGPQKIQIKIRLEMRLKMFIQIRGHLIFIRIDAVCLFILTDRAHNLVKCIRRKKIVVIQKPDKFPRSHGKSSICIFCNAQIFFQVPHMDPAVPGGILIQQLNHRLILWTSVCDTELPVRIGLIDHGADHLLQKFYRSPVCRNYHTDHRPAGKMPFSLFLQCFFIWPVCLVPRSVGNLFRFKPFMQPNPEFLRPVVLQISEALLNRIGGKLFQHFLPLNPAPRIIIRSHEFSFLFLDSFNKLGLKDTPRIVPHLMPPQS